MYLRKLLQKIYTRYSEPLTPLDESVLGFRVWLTDAGFDGQLHHGRYLDAMALGRDDIITRVRLQALIKRQHWRLHTAAINMHFHQPLQLLQRYSLTTRLLCWDNQSLYLEQCFQWQKKTIALAKVRLIICGRSDSIAPGYILELLGYDPTSPNMPSTIQYWARAN